MLDLCRFLSWFQTRTLFHWRKRYYELWTRILVKSVLMMDLFSFCLLQMLTDGLEWCGLLVDYCDVFISCLDSHSDGTHSLQSIHCWDTDAETHFSKSDEETNSSWSWIDWGWAQMQQMFIFWVNYAFNCVFICFVLHSGLCFIMEGWIVSLD